MSRALSWVRGADVIKLPKSGYKAQYGEVNGSARPAIPVAAMPA